MDRYIYLDIYTYISQLEKNVYILIHMYHNGDVFSIQ